MPITTKFTDEQKKSVEQLADNLRTLRAAAKLTQQEMAEAVGLSRQTYLKIENKTAVMSWTTYLAFLYYFTNCPDAEKYLTILEVI